MPDKSDAGITVALTAETTAQLRDLAAARACTPTELIARLVEAEAARVAAPAPTAADLVLRQQAAVRDGREVAREQWTVLLAPAAAAEIERLPASLATRALDEARTLATDPHRGKPVGERWRVGFRAAGGQWRLVYSLDEPAQRVCVLVVTTRENAAY